MRKFLILLAVITSFSAFNYAQSALPTSTVRLPSSHDVVEKYVKAIGGREANRKIKSRLIKGSVQMMPMGIKGTFETLTAAEDRSITKMNLTGLGEFTEAFDGKVAWSVNPIQGNREKSGAELVQTKLINKFYRETELEELYPKMTVTGIEKVGESDAYVVRAEPVGLGAETLYFDVGSGLLVRTDMTILAPEGSQNAKIFYSDYRDADGVKTPFTIRTVLPQLEVIAHAEEVKTNAPVADGAFTKPKQ